MIEEKLVDFIKRGMDRGFHLDYLKEVLKKIGHSDVHINLASHKAILGHSRHPPKKKPKSKSFDMRNFAIGVMIAAIVFLIVLNMFAYSGEPEIKIITEKECPSIDNLETQEKIDQITILGDSISKAQAQIDKQFKTINSLNTTIEEKEQLINQQLEEMKDVNEKIKQERMWVKELLMDLVDYILSRA